MTSGHDQTSAPASARENSGTAGSGIAKVSGQAPGSNVAVRQVTFHVRRYVPGEDSQPRWQDYRIDCPPGMTVLEGLWKIKETLDPGLSWRFSCRMGICGSCGMLINGRPRLACNTQVAEFSGDRIALAPLPNFDIIRDLVPDLAPLFERHQRVQPFLLREDTEECERPTGEFEQSAHELESYLQFSYCIKCGCCMAACPTFATSRDYAGPMPLAQAHRYNTDSRDGGFGQRKRVLGGDGGPWRCHFAGECSVVCPKGVDPAKAVQIMKRELVLDLLRLRKRRCPSPPMPAPDPAKRPADSPVAPPPTVTGV